MIFKCKMCGGDLEIKENSTVCECEYCGTTQTLPKIDDDRRANLYDRANHFRRNNEFDKAMGIYEQILNDDGSDAEAYWSLVLCRYGIEYVEDPTTHKRVPTVNRAQFTSIFDDANYQSAIEHADSAQREVYKAEAEAINEIQKGILEISSKEEPFDVFICYKETDNNGRRTPDSVLANDLYHQLTQEGFKVFFARITLEDKLGSAYEPYIFAALNSAKVMVVLGTKPEYFNAVWVKNEWSRYLSLIKSGAKKMLIPAYKDMDPYDLPEEFSHLQAQDMSKLGFMQDLIRGIKKITAVDEPKVVKQETVVVQNEGNSNITALLKRAKMALEDGEFSKADDFCEQVLNQDAENADAYLYKLYAEYEICNRDEFRSTEYYVDSIKDSKNFVKACKFGKQAELDEDINEILYNQAAKKEEKADSEEDYKSTSKCFREIAGYKDSVARAKNCIEKGKECAYQLAEKAFASANNEETYNRASDLFRHVSGYKDADEKAEKAIEAGKEYAYQLAEKAFENANNEESYNKAAELYRHISGYKDADEKIKICEEKAEICRKEEQYKKANNLAKQDTIESLNQAIIIFDSISDWKDSAEIIEKCRQRIKEKEEEKRRRAEIAEQERIAAEKKAQRKKKNTIIASCAAALVIIGAIVTNDVIIPSVKYNNAVSLMESGEYDEAINAFTELENYKDSAQKISDIENERNYKNALALLESGSYNEALSAFEGIKDFKDSADMILETKYRKALSFIESGSYEQAISILNELNGYKDSIEKIDACMLIKYNAAVELMNSGDYKNAATAFSELNGYKDSNEKIDACMLVLYNAAVELMNNGDYQNAIAFFSKLNEYKDSKEKLSNCIKVVRSKLPSDTIAAGDDHTVGLKADGTVVAVGDNFWGQCKVSGWKNIVAVAAGSDHTIGLKSDGTVVTVGNNENGQCDVSGWADIVAVSAGGDHTVGLKSDGTVVAVGKNNEGQCNVSDWTDIVAVAAGNAHTVGLKSDGTVVAVGGNFRGQCKVSGWKNIVAVAAGGDYTIGLKSDGTVVTVGNNENGQRDVSGWTDIVAVSAGYGHTIGLKADGTVVAVGDNVIGQCNVSDWKDIVAVAAGEYHTVGLKADGTVVAVGSNYNGQCYSGWTDIAVHN